MIEICNFRYGGVIYHDFDDEHIFVGLVDGDDMPEVFRRYGPKNPYLSAKDAEHINKSVMKTVMYGFLENVDPNLIRHKVIQMVPSSIRDEFIC